MRETCCYFDPSLHSVGFEDEGSIYPRRVSSGETEHTMRDWRHITSIMKCTKVHNPWCFTQLAHYSESSVIRTSIIRILDYPDYKICCARKHMYYVIIKYVNIHTHNASSVASACSFLLQCYGGVCSDYDYLRCEA